VSVRNGDRQEGPSWKREGPSASWSGSGWSLDRPRQYDRIGLAPLYSVRGHRWNSTDGITHEAPDFWDRRLSRLNADLFKATRVLATVRKFRRPVVQVNVAEQQVNVAG